MQAAVTGALSVAERSYPMSEVGAEARRTPCPRGGGQEALPHVRGQGQWPRVQAVTVQEQPRGATPRPRPGEVARRTYPMPEARGRGREEQPHAGGQGRWWGGPTPRPGNYPVWAQEGLEELSHVEGQEGRR